MPVSQLLSLRIPDHLATRLDQFARQHGNGMTRSRASLLLLEEAMRENEFALIEFRNSSIGRLPYMKDSGLAVWEVIMVAKSHAMSSERTAQYFRRSAEWVKAAFNYYEAFSEEIDQLIEDNNIGYEAMKRQLPNIQLFEVPQEGLVGEASP
jgi:predicted transcriptional regulator